MMADKIRLLGVALLVVVSVVVFVGSLIIMMSDAQGGVVIILAWPLLAVLLGLALVVSRRRNRTVFRAVAAWAISIVLFFVLGPIPFVGEVPRAIVSQVAKSFELLTGKTPRAYFHARNDVPAMIDAQLGESNGEVIDFTRINPRYDFTRVCVFPPYSDESTVRAKIGFELSPDWKLNLYSPIATDDGIDLILLTDGHSISYSINLLRSKADLSPQGVRCLDRSQAVFRRAPGEGNGHVFRN